MREELEQKLANNFTFMKNVYCQCNDGWFNLLYELCSKINEVYENFNIPVDIVIDQLKEKFGTLRFYYSFIDEPVFIHAIDTSEGTYRYTLTGQDYRTEIDKITREYEDKSGTVCEICGDLGKLRTDSNWIQVLCDSHYEGGEII